MKCCCDQLNRTLLACVNEDMKCNYFQGKGGDIIKKSHNERNPDMEPGDIARTTLKVWTMSDTLGCMKKDYFKCNFHRSSYPPGTLHYG